MDTNQYRKKRTDPYLGGALSDKESKEFLAKYNKRTKRKCISCPKEFMSKGSHNRKCFACKQKQYQFEKNNKTREPEVYRTTGKFRSTHHFIGEIE